MSAAPEPVQDRERLLLALDSYSSNDLARLLEQYSPGASSGRRRAERIEQVAALFSDPSFASRVVSDLSPDELRLLRVVARYRHASVAALNLTGEQASSGVYTSSDAIASLLERGLLLYEHREIGRGGTAAPSSTPASHQWLWAPPAILAALPPPPDAARQLIARQPPERIEAAAFPLVRRDLYVMLRLLRSRGVRLTRTGHAHRTDLRKLLEALEPTTGSPRRDMSDPALNGRVMFMLRLLIRAGLAVPEYDALRGSDRASALLEASEAVAARILFEAWIDAEWDEFQRIGDLTLEPWYYGGAVDVPGLDDLAQARRTIVDALSRFLGGAAEGDWLDLRALADFLRQDDPEFLIVRLDDAALSGHGVAYANGMADYYHTQQLNEQRYYHGFVRREARGPDRRLRKDRDWADVEGAFVEQVIAESLYWLGLVDLGYAEAQERPYAVRITPLFLDLLQAQPESVAPPRTGRALVVQPNFDVLVLDALARLDLLSQLDEFAEPRSLDRAAVYALSRGALVAGLAAGWTEERVVRMLESASGEPLPQNVRRTLHGWAQEFERVHLYRSVTLLEAPQAGELDRLLAAPNFASALVRRLTPTVALLRLLAPAEVAAAMEVTTQCIRHVDYLNDPPRVLDLASAGEALAPVEADEPYLDYRLRKFADRVSTVPGDPARYLISPESLHRAVYAGMSIDDVLAFLRFKARLPLSPDDVFTLRGWAGFHPPFRFASVRAVELPPTVTWAELGRVKALQRLVARVLSPNLALVDDEHWETFQAELRSRGVVLKPELPKQPATERRLLTQGGGTSAPRAITATRHADGGVAGVPHGFTSLRPGDGGAVTGRNTRLRRLHGRALTDFIERALDEEAPILIEYRLHNERREKLRVVEPLDLEVRGGAYYLQAYCRLRREGREFRLSDIRGVALATE